MLEFPSTCGFRHTWRPYQQRVLERLGDHLDDNHLHVVAAPGSGKTVLGLEVMRLLNQPTLVLAPTVAIRDQWIERWVQLFCQPDTETDSWISRDVAKPKLLTVSTYQGLHQAMAKTESRKQNQALLRGISKQGVHTLVLDEAHHLRKAWWNCLIQLKEHLESPTIVALTATAPFDVGPAEWARYLDLCGPIDAEITVPELVRAGNLCPHQDYVYLSPPLHSEQQELQALRAAVTAAVGDLNQDSEWLAALARHPQVQQPLEHLETILADPAFYTSLAIYLEKVASRPARKLKGVLGWTRGQQPVLDHAQLELLLTGALFSHTQTFPLPNRLTERIAREFTRLGAVDQRTVSLRDPRRIATRLLASASKLDSIRNIVELERQALGKDLRMVVLTDYIRREDFPKKNEEPAPLKRLGVVPIFEHLRRDGLANSKLGILSGTLVIIPEESRALLETIAGRWELGDSLHCTPLAFDPAYCEVRIRGLDRFRMVRLITELFNQGGLSVLVGTTALLGEGWDAPSVNALVLASFVGSYMLSNQMRGRAIRVDPEQPDKVANIWHLVCQEPDFPEPGPDLALLQRRFTTFAGVSFVDQSLGSGWERMGLGRPPYSAATLQELNETMIHRARDRQGLKARWDQVLAKEAQEGLVELVTTSKKNAPRSFVLANARLALLWQAVFGLFGGLAYYLLGRDEVKEQMAWVIVLWALTIGGAFAVLAGLPFCLELFWRSLFHASPAASLKQVGKAVLQGLIRAERIESDASRLRVVTQRLANDQVGCTLKGALSRERVVFLEALEEVLAPIDNPRYLLVRKTPLGRWLRGDYIAVPGALARNKDLAQDFQALWTRRMGRTTLIYTRAEEGLRLLLKARGHALSDASSPRTQRLRRWQ